MSSSPRIAIDLRALVGEPSGIGFFTLSILRELAARPFAKYVGLSHRPVTFAKSLASAGVELEVEAAPLGVWWQQSNLPRRLERGDLDLLWSPLTTLPNRLAIPSVVTVHDMTVVRMPESHRAKLRWSILPFLRRTLRNADRICVDSRSTANDVLDYFPDCSDRMRVVYPAIDPEFQPAQEDQVATTRAELACPEGYALFTGTLEPRKNVARLLDAWETLAGSGRPAPRLVLVGPHGWHSRALLARIDSLAGSGLLYLGRLPRKELVRVVQAASLFVYPSLYEGFGLPPAEAMACGVPAIVSNRSSLPEVVGDAGIQVDPDSSEAIGTAIERLWADRELAADLGRRSLARARRFDRQGAAERMEEVFTQALR